jgi:adenylate cyclase class 2
MNEEIEIQAIIKKPEIVERKLRKIGKYVKTRRQVDNYFIPVGNNFFAEEPPIEYLRVRHEKDRDHLNYSYLHFDKKGYLIKTDEYETIVKEPKIVEDVLKKTGFVLKVTVVKIRKYFNCGDFEVTLDQVKGLGNFMEVEAKKDFGSVKKTRDACQKFLDGLRVEYKVERLMGYPRMLYRKLN